MAPAPRASIVELLVLQIHTLLSAADITDDEKLNNLEQQLRKYNENNG